MLYKKVIKRGVKDLTFIQNFLVGKLEGKSEIVVNINGNVYNKICCKYGRILKYHTQRKVIEEGIFYNDEKYSFSICGSYSGKYGLYYKLHVKDIEKSIQYNLEKRIKELKCSNEELKSLYVEMFKIQENDNFKVFNVNFESNNTNNLLQNESVDTDKIFDKIELILDQEETKIK